MVGKKPVHMRARKKAALAEAHRGRGRVWHEMGFEKHSPKNGMPYRSWEGV